MFQKYPLHHMQQIWSHSGKSPKSRSLLQQVSNVPTGLLFDDGKFYAEIRFFCNGSLKNPGILTIRSASLAKKIELLKQSRLSTLARFFGFSSEKLLSVPKMSQRYTKMA